MTKCPKCGEELSTVSDISSWEKQEYCRNEKCKGWFCFYCDKWHPYGTFCSEAEVIGYYITAQHIYDKWCIEHKEDLFRMLKDSGYYNHWHDVDKYYPKDEEEDDGL